MKKQLPDAEIHFVTKKSFKLVTEHSPYIDKFFYFENNMEELLEMLKKEKYDAVIDLHKNFRSLKIKRALKATSYTIDKLSLKVFINRVVY